MGNAQRIDPAKKRFGQRRAGGIGIDHHDRQIDRWQRGEPVGGEADPAGGVDQREMIVEIVEVEQVDLGRAAPGAGFGTGVADAGPGFDAALAVDRPAGVEEGFGRLVLPVPAGPIRATARVAPARPPTAPAGVFLGWVAMVAIVGSSPSGLERAGPVLRPKRWEAAMLCLSRASRKRFCAASRACRAGQVA